MIKTKLIFSCFIIICQTLQAHIPTQQETATYRSHLDGLVSPKCISTSEGAFVYCYNSIVAQWLEKAFDLSSLKEIEKYLKPHLSIPLTKEGFSQAVAKPEGDQFGEVSYSAVWVRDSCWHYYGLKTQDRRQAAKLVENLLRFYSSEEQISRFLSVIKNPNIADPSLDSMAHMNVPLIRFSGKTLSHHRFKNKDQEWNHLQFDSHGLFLLALSDALTSGILQPQSLTQKNYVMLTLFPAFFSRTNYAQKPDAGPWEERLQYNASSAGLVASGIKRIMEVLHSTTALEQGLKRGIEELKKKEVSTDVIQIVESAMSNETIQHLYQSGLDRVEKNLSFGGEAPDLTGEGIDRRADAALLFLCLVEHTPFFDDAEKIKQIININSSLIGPYGIYRYRYDPYQSLNYWIAYDVLSPIDGAKTPLFDTIKWWKKGYMPHQHPSDAQWFFDSCFADLYYHLSIMERDHMAKAYYLKHGDIHLKRALAQLTGPGTHAANGQALEMFQLPESINTVLDSYYNKRPFPSPISPLNWAKAAMQMAFKRAQSAHANFEGVDR